MQKKTILYGIIAGTFVSILMLIGMNYMSHCEGTADYNTSMLVGYASMLLAFSLVFVGIRNYRDKSNGGLISFGQAFKIGITIVLIASTMYVAAWLIDYFFFIPDFMDKYTAHTLEELKASGASEAEIATQTKEMADFAVMYQNPLIAALFTYMEIFPVGLLVTLISAFILKRKVVPAVE